VTKMKLQNIVSTTFLIALLTVVLFVGVWQIKPVYAEDTFGNTSAYSLTDDFYANTMMAYNFTASTSGTIVKIAVYCNASSGTINLKSAIFSVNASGYYPDVALSNSSDTVSVSTTVGWYNTTHSLAVTAGTNYCLVFLANGNGKYYYAYPSGYPAEYQKAATYPNFASPFGNPSVSGRSASIYAVYGTGGGPSSGGGTVSTNEYITVNTTGTYEWNSSGYCVSSGTNAVAIINNATTHVSPLHGSVYVYNETYQLSGTLTMPSNVNMTLNDGVYFNHTSNNHIFDWVGTQNSTLWAYTNATIHGVGTNGYDFEKGFWLDNVVNITIGAQSENGLTIFNTAAQCIESDDGPNNWVNNSLFQNFNASFWCLSTSYQIHGIVLDGVQNCQFINLTVDGRQGVNTRSCLVIGGDSEPSNNINITGGIYERSYRDNGIYLGGWYYNVTNCRITNVTTYANNGAHSGHAGLKIRPASNITITGWNSTDDYYGMEMGTNYDTVTNGESGSRFNYVQGTITTPYMNGLILATDGSDQAQSVIYNTFNLTINNATIHSAVWINNYYPSTLDEISYNTFYINATGNNRQIIDFGSTGGSADHNTFFVEGYDNGKAGYPDLSVENTTGCTYNTFNYYGTTDNPNGLMDFVNGTGNNWVYDGYLGTNTTVILTVTVNLPSNTTYTYSSVPVKLSVIVNGGSLDKIWWNCTLIDGTVVYANTTYTVPTTMVLGIGTYIFHAMANNTDGISDEAIVMFTVVTLSFTSEWGGYWGRWWGYP